MDELTTILSTLISKKTVNPPGDESLVTDYIKQLFTAWNIPFETFEKTPGRTNIIGTVGQGKPVIAIICHSDVVPPGENWETDPFTLVEKEGKFYGRGVVDNKGPLTSILLAAKECAKQCTVKIVAAADEEKGSKQGAIYLLNECNFTADYVIIPDIGGNLKNIDIAEKGRLEIKVIAKGRQGHGAYPESGSNAINTLSEFITKLQNHQLTYTEHPFLSPPTINVGNISGGDAANMIPALATATLDIRTLPSMTTEKVLVELQSIAKENIEFEVLNVLNPTQIPPDNKLVEAIMQAITQVTHNQPKLVGTNGATIAKPFIEKGIPAVGIGIGDMMHVANECIEKQEIINLKEVLLKTIEILSK